MNWNRCTRPTRSRVRTRAHRSLDVCESWIPPRISMYRLDPIDGPRAWRQISREAARGRRRSGTRSQAVRDGSAPGRAGAPPRGRRSPTRSCDRPRPRTRGRRGSARAWRCPRRRGTTNRASNEVPSPKDRGAPVGSKQRDAERVRAGFARAPSGPAAPARCGRAAPGRREAWITRQPIPSAWSLPPAAWTESARNASICISRSRPSRGALDHEVEAELELLVGGRNPRSTGARARRWEALDRAVGTSKTPRSALGLAGSSRPVSIITKP